MFSLGTPVAFLTYWLLSRDATRKLSFSGQLLSQAFTLRTGERNGDVEPAMIPSLSAPLDCQARGLVFHGFLQRRNRRKINAEFCSRAGDTLDANAASVLTDDRKGAR